LTTRRSRNPRKSGGPVAGQEPYQPYRTKSDGMESSSGHNHRWESGRMSKRGSNIASISGTKIRLAGAAVISETSSAVGCHIRIKQNRYAHYRLTR
jgi:hypothetical protein